MKIKTLKTVEEEMEIEVPSFYERCGSYFKITEQHVIQILESGSIITDEIKGGYGKNKVEQLVNEGITIPENEFDEKFFEAVENIHNIAGLSNIPTLQNVMP